MNTCTQLVKIGLSEIEALEGCNDRLLGKRGRGETCKLDTSSSWRELEVSGEIEQIEVRVIKVEASTVKVEKEWKLHSMTQAYARGDMYGMVEESH